jgi:hypothetical protein
MTQPITPVDSLLATIVLGTLAIGLPVLMVLTIRFLWDRNLNLGRSKELEKLIWQLHRIASAMEHQMNLSFPPVQPGAEDPRDVAYLQQISPPPIAVAQSEVSPSAVALSTQQVVVQPPVMPVLGTQQASVAPAVSKETPVEVPRRAGVNSMFDL